MKKWSLLFLVFSFCIAGIHAQASSSVLELRESLKGDIEKERLDQMVEELKKDDSDLALGYLGVVYFLKSKQAFMPTTKFKHFSKGCTYLDRAIEQSPENCELRYLRLIFQHEIPKFLGYDNEVEEDFSSFIKAIDSVEPQLSDNMRLTLLNLNKLSSEKKNILKTL